MKSLSKKTETFTDSVIRRMTRIANAYGAVNLSQGFPDFAPPAELTARLAEVAARGPHQYAVTWGAQNFREAVARKQAHFSGMEVDPDREIVVTCGSTEAMMATMLALIDPGDKVVIFSPFYENYGADVILAGAEPIYVPLRPPAFTFDADELEAAFKRGAKALVLCNPSNPTGKVFTRGELDAIARLAREYDAYVITDEVYEHILYAPHEHVYMSTLPEMRERTIVCNSLSKTYSITGWRLGYTIAPPAITERIKKVHDFLTVGAAAPLMEAAIAGLELGDDYYEGLQAHYRHMKDVFVGGLKELGYAFHEPEGAYYVLLDVTEFQVGNDLVFAEWLCREVGVAAVPGSSFFEDDVQQYVRFHFAKGDATLREAIRRLGTLRDKAVRAKYAY